MGLNLGTGFALGNALNNLPPKTGNGTGGNANAFYNAIDTGMVSSPRFDPRLFSLVQRPNQQTVQNRNPVPQNIQFRNNPFQNGQQVGISDIMRTIGNRQPFFGNQQPFFGTPSQAFMPETDWVRMANAGYDRAGRPIQQPLPRRPMQNQPQPQPQRPNIPWLMW